MVTIYLLTVDSFKKSIFYLKRFQMDAYIYISTLVATTTKVLHVLPSHVFNSANQVPDLFTPLF